MSYPGLDKRLDEWIAESLIVSLVQPPLAAAASPSSDASAGVDPATSAVSTEGNEEGGEVARVKTKTELRHEKEKRSLAHELSGFRKRKREVRMIYLRYQCY